VYLCEADKPNHDEQHNAHRRGGAWPVDGRDAEQAGELIQVAVEAQDIELSMTGRKGAALNTAAPGHVEMDQHHQHKGPADPYRAC
jgi:hypothetical protein